MKTYKNLYEKIYDFENLYLAYQDARRCKRYRGEVLAFSANLEENLIDIQNHLIYQSYTMGEYREFYVYEPKKRLIMALPFRDRVVQCALYRVVNPLFTRSYIDTSYGSIVGRGPLKAVEKLRYWLRLLHNKPEKYYALKMDVAKFFFRIPHDVQMASLERRIDDPKTMWLFEQIIRSRKTPFGLPLDAVDVANCTRLYDIGMPVGNLISQMLANIVMDAADQYIKRELKCHYYMRYMDDMLVLGADKQELREIMRLVSAFLEQNLGLCLNNRTSIRPVSLGVEFVGYRVWQDRTQIRKSTSLRMKRRLRATRIRYGQGKLPLEKAQSTITSYLGLMKHCDCDNLRDKVLEDFVLVRHSDPRDE